MKSEPIRYIQVFLVGDTSAEINGEEIYCSRLSEGVLVRYKEEETVTDYLFPYAQIRMIRRWTEEA